MKDWLIAEIIYSEGPSIQQTQFHTDKHSQRYTHISVNFKSILSLFLIDEKWKLKLWLVSTFTFLIWQLESNTFYLTKVFSAFLFAIKLKTLACINICFPDITAGVWIELGGWVMPTSAKKLCSIPNETRQPSTNKQSNGIVEWSITFFNVNNVTDNFTIPF